MVIKTHTVLYKSEQVLAITKDFDAGSRGYVITGDSTFLIPFAKSKDIIIGEIKKLKKLPQDNPGQQARIDSLSMWIEKRFQFTNQTINRRNQEGFWAAASLVASGRGVFYSNKIKNTIATI